MSESVSRPDHAAQSLLTQGIEEYLRYLRNEKRASPHTISAAGRDLVQFARACQKAGFDRQGQVDLHFIRQWVAQLHRAGRNPRTVARMLSSVRSWLRHETALGRLTANPAQAVRPPKGRRALPRGVEADVLISALDRGVDDSSVWALRDHAIVELLYSSGMRLSELQALDTPGTSMPDELRVFGKGGKTRVIPVGRKARVALDAWLVQRQHIAAAGERALFVARSGRRLTTRGIQLRVSQWAKRSGLPVHLYPHRLRHAFATHLLENSGELRAVQELLGHANLATTQIYTAVDWKHLAQIYDAAHPRAHKT